MLNVANVLTQHVKGFNRLPGAVRQGITLVLRGLLHESTINTFMRQHQACSAPAFVDQVLEHLDVDYSLHAREIENIPVAGRVVIIANHPLGALDGLALLQIVASVRPDVQIVANTLLSRIEPLQASLLPVDNLSRRGFRHSLKQIGAALDQERAVIVFPAGEVSRLHPRGIRDRHWEGGFLHLARRHNAPILPMHISGRNSWYFYCLASLRSELGTLLLAHEMFGQRGRQLSVRIGSLLPLEQCDRPELSTAETLKLLRRHVYRLGHRRRGVFRGEAAIAHPEDRAALRCELRKAEWLGDTTEGRRILLYRSDAGADTVVLRELGRLREITFRRVGEGTGRRRDLDRFDSDYQHLLIWDDHDLEIVGAYRLAEANQVLDTKGLDGLYTANLFHMDEAPWQAWRHGLELGRSFVQPRYQGRRGLDALWLGLGAWLRRHPDVRWLFGPVSISSALPLRARELLVAYYRHYYGEATPSARARAPFRLTPAGQLESERLFCGYNRQEDLLRLRQQLEALNVSVPILYRQYCQLVEHDGVRFVDFSVDANFGYCLDGLMVLDLTRLKPEKRRRYLGNTSQQAAASIASSSEAS